MRVSVVIPTFNERETIKALIKRIFALQIPAIEIIVIDDSSTDGTAEIVRALKKRFPVTLILRPRKLGLGSALKDGLALAKVRGAHLVITLDADLSHDPALIPKLMEKVEEGADLVIGSRRIAGGAIYGWRPWRSLMSRTAMEFSRQLLKISAKDVTSGFRAYRRRVLETIVFEQVSSTGYAFQEEMLYRVERAGLRVVEIPIVFHDRQHGKSKLGMRDIVEFFITILRLRFYA